MKKIVLTLTLILITTNAYAEWTFYGKNTESSVFFYDKSTLIRNGNKVKVWSYFNFSPNNEKAKSLNMFSARMLEEIDCVNQTLKRLSTHFFTEPDLNGDMSNDTKSNPTIVYIAPDSINTTLMKLVCKK
jgi:hypothetical protein